ncbi:tail assembly chaperone [Mycobacterium phage MrMiyagi]|uniref:Tail assembly chaperone n=1 Tax=Mycobacterium phage MrMiyagi TaxID=2762395 RepID=A0A7G8LPR3_9CAUD|nr:tail assembly chaperone [Mycobacterium phage MrMiyagi]
MSYPGVDPAVLAQVNPVGTQESAAGEPMAPNPLVAKASETMHESALREPVIDQSAVKAAVADMFALQDGWKPKQAVKFVIECPSGQRVLARHLDTMALLEANLIEEIDFFTKRLFPAEMDASGNVIEKPEDAAEASIWTVLKDPEKRCRFLRLMNGLLVTAIERPKIIDDGVEILTDTEGKKHVVEGARLSPEDYEKVFKKKLRPLGPNETYASAVDFADKMAIYSELNKPLAVITPFREEQAISLARMASGESSGGIRPSELYGITWPLAAFYLDRGLYWWSSFVEGRMNEVENAVRNQMKNKRGTDAFVHSARTAAFNKLMGLSVASAYRQPHSFTSSSKGAKPVASQGKSSNFDNSLFGG